MGAIDLPAKGKSYYAAGPGMVWRIMGDGAPEAIAARPVPDVAPVGVASRSHRDAATEAWIEKSGAKDFVSAGSSLKLCRLAEGSADLYPRLGRTMEWDIAAGQAILEAAGGSVTTLAETGEGAPLRYGKAGFENPHFVARGRD